MILLANFPYGDKILIFLKSQITHRMLSAITNRKLLFIEVSVLFNSLNGVGDRVLSAVASRLRNVSIHHLKFIQVLKTHIIIKKLWG